MTATAALPAPVVDFDFPAIMRSVREARLNQGMSLKALGAAIKNPHHHNISAAELHGRRTINLEDLVKIHKVLKMPLPESLSPKLLPVVKQHLRMQSYAKTLEKRKEAKAAASKPSVKGKKVAKKATKKKTSKKAG